MIKLSFARSKTVYELLMVETESSFYISCATAALELKTKFMAVSWTLIKDFCRLMWYPENCKFPENCAATCECRTQMSVACQYSLSFMEDGEGGDSSKNENIDK